jgi:hypothetical protein
MISVKKHEFQDDSRRVKFIDQSENRFSFLLIEGMGISLAY